MSANKPPSAKIAVSLPRELLRGLERLCREAGESRSAFVQRLIRERLERDERDARAERYEQGYREHPETRADARAAEASATALFAEEPWE